MGFPDGALVKNLPAMQEMGIQSLGWVDSPRGGTGNPLQYSCLENSRDQGAWWAPVHSVAKRQSQLGDWQTQGPAIQHRGLYSILRNDLRGRRTWKILYICTCVTDSLCYTEETNRTFYYMPIKYFLKSAMTTNDNSHINHYRIPLPFFPYILLNSYPGLPKCPSWLLSI